MRIADLGAGSGVGLVHILAMTNKRIYLVGFDSSEGMLRRNRDKIRRFAEVANRSVDRENIKNLRLVRHDLTEEFPKGEKFDIVFLSFVVNHIPVDKREKFFENINSILKENGLLIMAQLINQSKHDRNFADWLLWVTQTHQGFPFKNEYLAMLSKYFKDIKGYLNSNIIIARRR